MDLDKIIDKAVKYADQQEGSPKSDEWHSAYYGYIKGYQDANRNNTESEGQKGEEATEALHKHGVINWVAIDSNEMPEPVTDVLVRFKAGNVACRFFDGDRRFYNLANDMDITDNIKEWAALPK